MFGIYVETPAAEREMGWMLDALAARGPDGAAAHIDRRRRIMLGLRSLRVSPAEPESVVLANEDQSLLLVCDGHVFNSAELTDWLQGKGHSVRSSHSCETLLRLYEQEGIAGWQRADGQFALALWDGRKNAVLLARDCLGVRPLYYCASSGGVIFASQIRALMQHSGVPCALDEVAVSHYLTFLNVPGPRTLFAGIRKVPAGTVAHCNADGSVQLEQYWDLVQDPIPEQDDERFYVDRARELHAAAVLRRKVDGPIGALLSGGNDSSANVALLARYGSGPLHTFTVGLADLEGQSKYNDLEYARKVAALAQSQHHEALLTTEEFLQTIPITVDAMEDVVSEPSSVFLYHALRLAKEQSLRVVITGEANDELSCGHEAMMQIREGFYRRWRPFQRLPLAVRRAAAAVAPLVSPQRREILQRAAAGDEYFWSFETAWMETEKPEILTETAWERCRAESPAGVVHRYAQRLRSSQHGRRDYLNHIIYVMMQDYYFGNLMLGKLDLLAAHVGVEARCPYTDPAYAHFVFNIPARFKTKDNLVKYFFKKAITGLLPDEIIYRPKQGFRTPVVELFQGALGDWARPILLEAGLTRAGFLRPEHLDRLLLDHRQGKRDYSNRLWTAMMLNLWYDRWIQGRGRTPASQPTTKQVGPDGVLTLSAR